MFSREQDTTVDPVQYILNTSTGDDITITPLKPGYATADPVHLHVIERNRDDFTYTLYAVNSSQTTHAIQLLREHPGEEWQHPALVNLQSGGRQRIKNVVVR